MSTSAASFALYTGSPFTSASNSESSFTPITVCTVQPPPSSPDSSIHIPQPEPGQANSTVCARPGLCLRPWATGPPRLLLPVCGTPSPTTSGLHKLVNGLKTFFQKAICTQLHGSSVSCQDISLKITINLVTVKGATSQIDLLSEDYKCL